MSARSAPRRWFPKPTSSAESSAALLRHHREVHHERTPVLVRIIRTEIIAFQIDADSEDDARDRYLMDGDEVASETTDLIIASVEEGTAAELLTNPE